MYVFNTHFLYTQTTRSRGEGLDYKKTTTAHSLIDDWGFMGQSANWFLSLSPPRSLCRYLCLSISLYRLFDSQQRKLHTTQILLLLLPHLLHYPITLFALITKRIRPVGCLRLRNAQRTCAELISWLVNSCPWYYFTPTHPHRTRHSRYCDLPCKQTFMLIMFYINKCMYIV